MLLRTPRRTWFPSFFTGLLASLFFALYLFKVEKCRGYIFGNTSCKQPAAPYKENGKLNSHFKIHLSIIKYPRRACDWHFTVANYFCNISNTRDGVSSGYPNTDWRELKLRRASEYFGRNSKSGVWIAVETLSRVFEISSIKTKTNEYMNGKGKSSKLIYAN